jgi:hypothetical protein
MERRESVLDSLRERKHLASGPTEADRPDRRMSFARQRSSGDKFEGNRLRSNPARSVDNTLLRFRLFGRLLRLFGRVADEDYALSLW